MKLKTVKDRIFARLFTRYPWLLRRWARNAEFIEFSRSPWTPLRKDLKACRVALVTTAGVHLKTQPPFDMSDPEGDPTFREIPFDVDKESLTITHDYYDHRDADADINVVLPFDRLAELVADGFIGSVSTSAFSFMGHITGKHIATLMSKTASSVASKLKEDRVDVVLLTPT